MLQLELLALLAWMTVLNQSAAAYLKQKEADLQQEAEEEPAKAQLSDKTEKAEKEESAGKPEKEEAAERTEEAENRIRVLLTTSGFQSYFHPSVTILRAGETLSFDPEAIEALGGTKKIPAHENGICVASVLRQGKAPVYQGDLEITNTQKGLVLVNEVPLETYLESVVPSEMPAGYEGEALKAQAVCARTYAWKQMQEKKLQEYGADVDDSVNYQVYGNLAPQDTTTAAVKETEGLLLCCQGQPVEAYYFSTSAGATSTDEIWGAEEAAPHLKSVVCEFDSREPWSRWETELPWAALEERAGRKQGGGALYSVSVTEKNQSGAVTGLQVATEKGFFVLTEEYEIRKFLNPSGCMITERDGQKAEGGELLPSAYFELEMNPGTSVEIRGGGYGHGVGMSQTAANEMAKEGYDFREILDYFFRDIEIKSKAELSD